MSLLAANDLELHFGSRTLFDGLSLAIEPGDRLGLVGPNGSGKSTLLKLLAGTVMPNSGLVSRAKGVRVGYLAQEHADPPDEELLDYVLSQAPGRDGLESRAAELERLLDAATDTEAQMSLAAELADVHEVLRDIANRWAPHRAQTILCGLRFKNDDFKRPLSEFSGGWRMRGELAALLYAEPDILLLDEPTNHLDMPSVQWLSTFLKNFRRALVLTCHDRTFLNRHVKRVASLELEGVQVFRGNYDEYLVQREIALGHLEARHKKNEQRKKEMEAFVDRFRAKATKARQAQNRVRQIEKLEDSQVDLPQLRRSVSIRFDPVDRAGGVVADVQNLDFGYAGKRLFNGLNLKVHRQDRIAIAGVNGAGKTTLLRLLARELEPLGGDIVLGHNVRISYFAQHTAAVLRPHATVLEEVWSAAPEWSETRVRTLSGAFLFSGDDVDKPISVLSGGEKMRVALAKMLTNPGNLLLLDEPTNHLDTESADKLTESLSSYDGTLIFVSHNIDFAARLSTKVWDLEEGVLNEYPGSLQEYLRHLSEEVGEADAVQLLAGRKDLEAPTKTKAGNKAERMAERKARAAAAKERAAVEKRVAEAEAEVGRLEGEVERLEALLADPEVHQDPEKARTYAAEYESAKLGLEKAMVRWETAEAEQPPI